MAPSPMFADTERTFRDVDSDDFRGFGQIIALRTDQALGAPEGHYQNY